MTEKVRVGVIGVGYLGEFHLQKLLLLEQSNVVGFFDPSQSRSEEIKNKYNVQSFESGEELISNVDALLISAPTQSHYEWAKKALNCGKHVFIEKPICQTSKEAEELCRLAESKNLKLQVGHIVRFDPSFKAAKDRLKTPVFLEANRLAPFKTRGVDVNVVLDLMIHDLDVLLSLVPSNVKSVSAVGIPVLTSTIDIANARIEFETGAVANLTASRVSVKSERKMRVFQKDQYLSIDFVKGELRLTHRLGDFNHEKPLDIQAWSLAQGDSLLEESKSFLNSIIENKDCKVTGWDGLKALRLAEEIIGAIEVRHVECFDSLR